MATRQGAAPPSTGQIELFISTVSGNLQIKKRQTALLAYLDGKKIPYTAYDISQDAFAEQKQRVRDINGGNIVLPSIVINGARKDYDQFAEAMENGDANAFFA
ncbi:hypothetical protein RI367_002237 [Sorochytrium milnesiophthora]